jgi:PAS domain S-box-containing protein
MKTPQSRWPDRVALAAAVFFATLFAGGGWLATRALERQALDGAFGRVTSIGQAKAQQIETWHRTRVSATELLATWIRESRTVPAWLARPADAAGRSASLALLDATRTHTDSAGAYLAAADGRVLLNTAGAEPTLMPDAVKAVQSAAAAATVTTSGFYYCTTCRRTHFDFVAPVTDDGGHVSAVLLLRTHPGASLYPLVASWPTQPDRGEALIFRWLQKDRFLFLSPPIFEPRRPIPSEGRFPLRRRATKQAGPNQYEGTSYRGDDVLADVRPVAGTPWFLVTQVSRDAVLADSRAPRTAVAAFVALSILLGFTLLWAVSRKRQRDAYRALYEVELRYHARVQHYEHVVRYAHDALFLADEGGGIVEANGRAAEMFGYGPDELLGQSLFALRDDGGGPGSKPRADEPAAPGEGRVFEASARRKDGSSFPVEVSARAIVIDGRRFYHEVIRDVAERRQLEASLRQAQRMEAIGRLAGGIAHDFNNILTVIIAYAEGCLDAALEPSVRDDITQIHQAGRRAARLTSQLLAFSRRQMMRAVSIDVNDVVRGCRPMLSRIIGADVEFETSLDPRTPNVIADPSQVEQILMNLVVNARDAMPNGGRLTIETSPVELDEAFVEQHHGSRTGRHALISVSDSGVGMDDATTARVFEPFFTTKPPGQGTGLGLAMVYGIVKQSSGSVWVYSTPGQGTSIRIYLPATDTPAAVLAESGEPARTTGTERILLVEDEEAVRQVFERLLREAGYTVAVAEDGQQALAAVERADAPFDLLLTDMVMPGVNGRDLARTLRARQPGLRVLLMSGYAESAITINQGLLAPGDRFLSKPATTEELRRTVREVLDASVSPPSA